MNGFEKFLCMVDRHEKTDLWMQKIFVSDHFFIFFQAENRGVSNILMTYKAHLKRARGKTLNTKTVDVNKRNSHHILKSLTP